MQADGKFGAALAFVGKVEGGYSDDRRDPGNWTGGAVGKGALLGTKYGISAASYPNEDIPNLTKARAALLYRLHYWDAIGADDLPHPLSLLAFDVAVNSGPSAALRLLEQTRNPVEFAALRLHDYTTYRLWGTYGKGWARRVAAALSEVAEHYDDPAPPPVPTSGFVDVVVSEVGDVTTIRRHKTAYRFTDTADGIKLDLRKIV